MTALLLAVALATQAEPIIRAIRSSRRHRQTPRQGSARTDQNRPAQGRRHPARRALQFGLVARNRLLLRRSRIR